MTLVDDLRVVRQGLAEDRVLSINTMGETSGAAIAYGYAIELLDELLETAIDDQGD